MPDGDDAVVDLLCNPTIRNQGGFAEWHSADELQESLNDNYGESQLNER